MILILFNFNRKIKEPILSSWYLWKILNADNFLAIAVKYNPFFLLVNKTF